MFPNKKTKTVNFSTKFSFVTFKFLCCGCMLDKHVFCLQQKVESYLSDTPHIFAWKKRQISWQAGFQSPNSCTLDNSTENGAQGIIKLSVAGPIYNGGENNDQFLAHTLHVASLCSCAISCLSISTKDKLAGVRILFWIPNGVNFQLQYFPLTCPPPRRRWWGSPGRTSRQTSGILTNEKRIWRVLVNKR